MGKSIMLSIKPEYVNLILKGKKKYEFRKRSCDAQVKKIYIYESAPKKKVVAEFEIEKILEGTPEYIWNECNTYGGICKEKFDEYFKHSTNAVAYKIGNVKEYDQPKELIDFGIDSAPQSFMYVK